MLGKLELDNREQLAAWRPERRRVLGLLAIPATLESLGRPLVWTGATLGGAAVVAVVVVVLLVLATFDGGDQQVGSAPEGTAAPESTAEPAATPRIPPTDPAVQLSVANGYSACAVRESGRLICCPRSGPRPQCTASTAR